MTNGSGSATLVCTMYIVHYVQVYRIWASLLDSEPDTIAIKTDKISFLFNPSSKQCCGSESRDPIESGSNPDPDSDTDPDTQHFLQQS